jgi:hypothetical protein
MDATITITGTCAGGNHVFLDVTIGGVTESITLTKNDLKAVTSEDFVVRTKEQAIAKQLRQYAKANSITKFSDLKTAAVNLPLSL